MKAYRHLLKFVLAKGAKVSVFDDEGSIVKKSTKLNEIVEGIEAVDEANLTIWIDGHRAAWVLVSAFGLEDDETVIDHTDNDFMQVWSDDYEAYLNK